jgi:hypothetical protein
VRVGRRILVAVSVLIVAALLGVGAGSALARFGAGGPADVATRIRLDARAAAVARALGITDPPMAQTVRIVTRSDWAATEVACMSGFGYAATATPEGDGISFDSEGQDSAAFQRAFYVCEVRYPLLDDAG